jgi:hypothetical protein
VRAGVGGPEAPATASPISWTEPPAASIFARAASDTASTCTVSARSISPLASSFTGQPRLELFLTSPAASRAAMSTVEPASKIDSWPTFTGIVWVRKGPIGIDILRFAPRSLPCCM